MPAITFSPAVSRCRKPSKLIRFDADECAEDLILPASSFRNYLSLTRVLNTRDAFQNLGDDDNGLARPKRLSRITALSPRRAFDLLGRGRLP